MTAHRTRRLLTALASGAALLALASCERSQVGSTVGPPTGAAPGMEAITDIPLGDVAGAASYTRTLANPYEGNAQAVQDGKNLFVKMNCAGCHGYTLGGGMGPNLADTYWRYGGAPAQIYNSIYQGRPRGMPAWGQALSQAEIWKITAYIEAHGGAFPATNADQGRQGNLGDQTTGAASSLKGLHDGN